MAKVTFGSIVTDARGKLGSDIYSRNRAGAYTRAYVSPVNTMTQMRTNVRNATKANSQAWRTLSEAQRAAWRSMTSEYREVNSLGHVHVPSGFNLFCKLNFWPRLLSLSIFSLPVGPVRFPDVSFVSLAVSSAFGTITPVVSPAAVAAGFLYRFVASQPLSAGINSSKQAYTNCGNYTDVLTPSQFWTNYNVYHDAPTAGKKIFYKMVVISTSNGDHRYVGVRSAIVT